MVNFKNLSYMKDRFTIMNGHRMSKTLFLNKSKFFIVCCGYQPSYTLLYDENGKFVKEIAKSKKNFIKISNDSRILCLAGFGNLNGEIELYNLAVYSMICKTIFFCGVSLNWSFDSKYINIAVTSPRVRVDNEYKVILNIK